MKPLKLLFIRHAQSVGNQQKRMQGNAEFELSAEGRKQAEKLAHRLLNEAWKPSWVYSSPQKRAVQTTEILLSRFLAEPLPAVVSDLVDDPIEAPLEPELQPDRSIPVEFADELREFQNGIFQGLTWAEAKAKYPQLCEQLENSQDWIQIPGAESSSANSSKTLRTGFRFPVPSRWKLPAADRISLCSDCSIATRTVNKSGLSPIAGLCST